MIRSRDVADLVRAALRHSATLEPDEAYAIVRIARVEVARVEDAIAERLGLSVIDGVRDATR